jgi:hypothetical protein
LIAITPLPADLMRPLAIETFTNWLDDIYLNPRVRASNNSSRFAESEDYSPLPDPTHRPRHSRYSSTSWSLQNGTVQRSAPGNILMISCTPTATDGSCATRGGTTTLLLRLTLAIVLKVLFVCPPPHNLLIPFQDLIVLCYKKILQIWEQGLTSHHHIEPNSIRILIFPTKTHSTLSPLLILATNATTHAPSPLPPNSIHQYPTMPSKISKRPPRKPPPSRLFRRRSQYIHPQDTILLTPRS